MMTSASSPPSRPMAELTDIQRDLLTLAADLKRLEAEYTMFFAGRAAAAAVGDARPRRGDAQAVGPRADSPSTSDRFRFEMLQSRFQSLIDLWDRGDAREAKKAGPAVRAAAAETGRPGRATATAAPRSCTSPRSRIRCARSTSCTCSTTR